MISQNLFLAKNGGTSSNCVISSLHTAQSTEILREIKFRESKTWKMAILTISPIQKFDFCEFVQIAYSCNLPKSKFTASKCG